MATLVSLSDCVGYDEASALRHSASENEICSPATPSTSASFSRDVSDWTKLDDEGEALSTSASFRSDDDGEMPTEQRNAFLLNDGFLLYEPNTDGFLLNEPNTDVQCALPGAIVAEAVVEVEGKPETAAPKTDIERLCLFGQPAVGISGSTTETQKRMTSSETLIFLDWDDTLCPSTCLHSHVLEDKKTDDALAASLLAHQTLVIGLLRLAAELGHVVIMTMADKAWVKCSSSKLMPEVAEVLKELDIEVVSARERCASWLLRFAISDDRDPSQYLKTKAMKRVIKKTFGDLSKTSKHAEVGPNIISIGDSWAERLALQDLCWTGQGVHGKVCQCKTLLMLEDPSLEQISNELRVVTAVLPAVVHFASDIDVDLDERDL